MGSLKQRFFGENVLKMGVNINWYKLDLVIVERHASVKCLKNRLTLSTVFITVLQNSQTYSKS